MLASCSKKVESVQADPPINNPIADYTVTPDANDGFTFKYNNLSKNYDKSRIEWRFGDDTLNTTESPTHTFLATGKYVTDLKIYSSTGSFSHKYININIAPDSVLKVSSVKTGNPYELAVSLTFKGNVKSVVWAFSDIDPATSNVNTVTYNNVTTVTRTFIFGSFNSFSVTVTSDKGSVATLSRNITPDGIVTDITQSRIAYDSNNHNLVQGPNEDYPKMIDGNTKTKFGYYSAWAVSPEIFWLQFPAPVTVKLYGIENGNDSESTRDPKEWYIEGSNDSTDGYNGTWDQLDYRSGSNPTYPGALPMTPMPGKGFADYLTAIGQYPTRYYRFFYYPIINPKPYTYYRWRIVNTFQNRFQIEEFRLYK
ncbi:MAG TPA: PKD domain-containing protein [Mucilaginibacter sp.]|nr:PKD domain-containing protein [Mucilaginibacter sp.]